MWTAAIVGGPHTLPALSSFRASFPPMFAPRVSALLVKKLVFLCPYLPSSQPVYLSTPTTSVDGPSLTFGASSPAHLPAAFPSMTATSKSSIPFWITLGLSLSYIVTFATFCYFASRTRPTDTQAVHRAERVQIQSENPATELSQTCIFTLGLTIGIALGLGIHSTPIPLMISALAQSSIDPTVDAVVQTRSKSRSFLWCKAEMLLSMRHLKGMVESLYNLLGRADSRYLNRTCAADYVEPRNIELFLWAVNLAITLGLCLVFNLLAGFLPVMSVLQLLINLVKGTWLIEPLRPVGLDRFPSYIVRIPYPLDEYLDPDMCPLFWKWTILVNTKQTRNVPPQQHYKQTEDAPPAPVPPIQNNKPLQPCYEEVLWQTVMENSPMDTPYPIVYHPRTRGGGRTRTSYFLHSNGNLQALDPNGRMSYTHPAVNTSWL